MTGTAAADLYGRSLAYLLSSSTVPTRHGSRGRGVTTIAPEVSSEVALPESERDRLLAELRTLQTRERQLVQSLQLALRARDQEVKVQPR